MFKLPGLPPLPPCSLGTDMAMKAQLTILASTGPPTNLPGKYASTRCARLSHSMNDPVVSFLMMMMTVTCDVPPECVGHLVLWSGTMERGGDCSMREKKNPRRQEPLNIDRESRAIVTVSLATVKNGQDSGKLRTCEPHGR